jgi:arylsulfatase A-like enzyme
MARAHGANAPAPNGHETPPAPAPVRGPAHAVYSLVDNRLAAHLERDGGLVVAAGSAGFAKYLRFGNTHRGRQKIWELRQTDDGARTAHMIGKSARIDVPLTTAQLATPTVRVRVWSAKPDTIGVRVNGGAEISAAAAAGWSTVELAVPSGQLVEGENQLVLAAKTAGHPVAWIEIGGATAPASDDVTAFYDASARALVLPDHGGMAWYAFVPAHARLDAELADRACKVEVRATAEDGATASGTLAGRDASVDLSSIGGKAARVELTASGCTRAALAHASLSVPGEPPPAPPRGDAPKYVVLFIMDSLRADRVRPFAPDARPETPEWDELAKTSAVFEQHYVQGNESRVSHSSIWTSLYPIKHGFLDAYGSLQVKSATVDKVAKEAGLYVTGVSANGYIMPARGFGTAWNQFSNHIAEEGGLTAAEVIAHGLQFLDKKKRDPWFLYLGTIDTHVTWHAKQPWMAKYDPRPYSGRFAKSFDGDDADRAPGTPDPYGVVTDREREHIKAIYDSNVSYQDDQLRQLVEKLKAWGVWDQTMLVVTADHGDEQWEVDDRVGHGWSVRDMLVRVPLLVHYPPMVPAGKVDEGTECIDITPTIADALGVAADPEWQGASLIPLAGGVGRGYPRLSVASMFEDEHGPRLAQWKADVRGTSAPKIYDLAHDPGELKDLWGDGKAEVGARFVLDPTWMLRTFNLDWKKARWGNAANVSAQFASDLGE